MFVERDRVALPDRERLGAGAGEPSAHVVAVPRGRGLACPVRALRDLRNRRELDGEAGLDARLLPVDAGLALEQLRFRYAISGSNPPWKPLRAFDDGRKVYIQFPAGIAQGELPPLFVIGPEGGGQLVNYRFRSPYYIVDRLFGAAELRLGADKGDVVRIERTDGVARRP